MAQRETYGKMRRPCPRVRRSGAVISALGLWDRGIGGPPRAVQRWGGGGRTGGEAHTPCDLRGVPPKRGPFPVPLALV